MSGAQPNGPTPEHGDQSNVAYLAAKDEVWERAQASEHERSRREAAQKSQEAREALRQELTTYAYEKAAFLRTDAEDASLRLPLLHPATGEVSPALVEDFVRGKLRSADEAINAKAAAEGLKQMEDAAAFDPPAIRHETFADLLADDDLPQFRYRIAGMHQLGGNAIIAAQAKVGKTTFMFNLVKALVDGGQFLGQDVIPIEDGKRVVYWDCELQLEYARDRMDSIGLDNPSGLSLIPMKGKTMPFNVQTSKDWIITHLKEMKAEVWVIDTLSRVYNGDEDSNTEVKRWLSIVDEIKERSGVKEVYIVHHAGHSAEGKKTRSRGASDFIGWPDTNWVLERVNQNDDSDTRRILRIPTGRGDLLDSVGYDWDKTSNKIFACEIVKNTVKRNKAEEFERLVWEYLTENGECSISNVVYGLSVNDRNKVSRLLAGWAQQGILQMRQGPKASKLYSVAPILSATVQQEAQQL